MFEEPTVAEEEREAAAREHMARAVAELIATSVPVSAVLVVARGPALPTGVLLGEHDRRQGKELDPVVLAEILTNAHDDRVALALTRLLLGDEEPIEHTVARDRNGVLMGVIAVRTRGRVSADWLRTVLARAGNGLAGWLSADAGCSWPPQALLEALAEPALAHEGGMVIVANTALGRLVGRHCTDIVGTPLSRITQRLTTLRTCSLVVRGRPLAALIFQGRTPRVETPLCNAVERVLSERYTFLRQTTRVTFDRREEVSAIVCSETLEEIVSLALLEMSTIFAKLTPANQLRVSVYRNEPWAVLELVATGSIAHGPEIEHLGAVVCASRARSVGGQFFTDTSRPESRTLRISLPVAS